MKKNVGKCKLRIATYLMGTALLFAGCDLSLNNGSERLNENDEASIAKELLNSGVSAIELAKAGVSSGALVQAGATVDALLTSGADLYNSGNTSDDWLGSDEQGYLLNISKVADSAYIVDDTTYGKVIDAYAAQSTTTISDLTGAKITASNPLSGTSATSVTLYARVKNAEGQNGYDALLSFTGTSDVSACAIMEAGGVHGNSAGYFDNVANLWTDSNWHTVVLVMNASTYNIYIDGVVKVSDGTISDSSGNWANNYWGATCTNFAVGAGFASFWATGYLNEGAYISDVALFPRALTASEIAALDNKTVTSTESSSSTTIENNENSNTNESNESSNTNTSENNESSNTNSNESNESSNTNENSNSNESSETSETVTSLLAAGSTVNDLLASGADLYNSGNTTDDWLGNAEKGYLLNVSKIAASTYIVEDTAYGKVIDANAAQSTTTAPDLSGAKITASNPLSGTTATSVTLYARVKNAAEQNGYDSLVTFCGTGNWTSCAIMEAGGVHANSAGYFDNDANIWTDANWHTVVLVMNAATYSLYIDGVAKVTDGTITNGSNWANTYWGTTCTSFAVGAGFTQRVNEEDLWAAGYVNSGAYISDVALFPRALTASEVAALEVE